MAPSRSARPSHAANGRGFVTSAAGGEALPIEVKSGRNAPARLRTPFLDLPLGATFIMGLSLEQTRDVLADGTLDDQLDASSWDLLMYLWSEEDAAVCCEVPTMQWFNAHDYHNICGKSVEECDAILDDLASRGLIGRSYRAGKNYYVLQPYIAGFWETTELKTFYENDEDPDACYEVLSKGMPGSDYGYNMTSCTLPMISANPVSKDVIAEEDYMPYFDWRQRLLSNTVVGVAACQCRIRNKAIDGKEYPEQFPTKRCMYMGESGEYFISIGAAEPITPGEDGVCSHSDVCIRCGQCVTVCPASARILRARDDFPYDIYPHDYQIDYMRFFAKERMARGLVRDFTGTELPEA